jgi:hypothetical protein
VHAHTRSELTIEIEPSLVRVEVADGVHQIPVRRHAAPNDLDGRGLHLVDQLSSRWGVDPTETGKIVWFEVARW